MLDKIFDEKDKNKPYEEEFNDEIKVVFKDEEVEVKEEDEEEFAPQNKEEYQVQSQLINEETAGLKPIDINKEMRTSFLEYAMSVIVSRALPDARDGLKPVHRRILYDMSELGITHATSHRKSARIVGDVLGKYHPHGDSSVYDAMVRMAQDFSLRYPLVDGHGNFGSIDGDQPAAMRYTEARMSKLASEMLNGIDKNTVDFIDNYDASEKEPKVLPSRFPNLLVSGCQGIAVGMATKIPPHNLGETIDATIALARNPQIDVWGLMQYIKGPDFPTGAEILGVSGIIKAYEEGRGSIPVRSKAKIETLKSGRERIVVTEIPYEVNKTKIVEEIAELIKFKKIDGISDLRDESNREGIRIVIELKKQVNAPIILNNLYRQTSLQTNYSANFVALVGGVPKLINLKEALEVYLQHQEEVVTRRLKYDLEKAKDKLHILEGLKIAVENIDEVIKIIKASKSTSEAQENLANRFSLSEKQTKAIVEMRLARLTGLAIEDMLNEMNELRSQIANFENILSDRNLLIDLIVQELEEIKNKYNDARRTIINADAKVDITNEDLIPQRDVVITTSTNGFVKRIDLDEYRLQRRGGIGSVTMKTYEDDDVADIITTTTHTDLLLFTNLARVYRIRAHEIPESSKSSKGTAFINIIPKLQVEENEKVIAMLPVNDYSNQSSIFFATKLGFIKRTDINEYQNINSNGKKAFLLRENDVLIRTLIINDDDLILLANNKDRVIKFKASDFRDQGRNAIGVRGMRLNDDEYVVSASSSNEGELILTIGKNGFGKLTHHSLFRLTKRGGKGIKAINAKLAGDLLFARFVNPIDEILTISNKGISIRTEISQISESGRAAKGVKIVKISKGDEIQAIEIIKVDAESNPEKVENALKTVENIKNQTMEISIENLDEEE